MRPDEVEPNLELSWLETDHSVSLLNGGNVVWRLNFDKSQDKPYFYPLRTPDGIDLALQRPDDHPWHRGLWFSWKYINEVNYWEEDPDRGLAEGRSRIKEVGIEKNEDYSAAVTLLIHYAPEGKAPVLIENRTLSISSPDKQGNYYIDWNQIFTAPKSDVVLDRTPPERHGGPVWGGYAGISFRASLDDLASYRYLDSNRWSRSESLTGYGEKARWMDLSGKVKNGKQSGQAAGLAIFDHPANPRHPSPWYVWYSNRGSGENYEHAFFTPAFLYNKPYSLRAGSSFNLRYRVWVHRGMGAFEEFDAGYRKYTR